MNKRLSCLTQKKSIKNSMGPINGDTYIIINTTSTPIKMSFLKQVATELKSGKASPLLSQVQTFLRLFFETLIEGKIVQNKKLSDVCPDLSTLDEKKQFCFLTRSLAETIEKPHQNPLQETYMPFKYKIDEKESQTVHFSLLPVIKSAHDHGVCVLDTQLEMKWTQNLDEALEKSCQQLKKKTFEILNHHLPVFQSQLKLILGLYHIAFEFQQQQFSDRDSEERDPPLMHRLCILNSENKVQLINLAHIFDRMLENQKKICMDLIIAQAEKNSLSELVIKIKNIQETTQKISSFFIKTIYQTYNESDLLFDTLSNNPHYQSFLFTRKHFSYDTVKKNIDQAVKKVLEKLLLSLKIEIKLRTQCEELQRLHQKKSDLAKCIDQHLDYFEQLNVTTKIEDKEKLKILRLNLEELNHMVKQTLEILKKKKNSSKYLKCLEENLETKLKESKIFLDQLKDCPMSVFKQYSLSLPYVTRNINGVKPLEETKKPLMSELSIKNLPTSLKTPNFISKKIELELCLLPQKTEALLLTEAFFLNQQLFFEKLRPEIPLEFSLKGIQGFSLEEKGQVFMLKNTIFLKNQEDPEKEMPPAFTRLLKNVERFKIVSKRVESLSTILKRAKPQELILPISFNIELKKGLSDIHLDVLNGHHQKIEEAIKSNKNVFIPVDIGSFYEGKTSLDLAIETEDEKTISLLFQHAKESSIQISIHVKTKYWVFVRTLISKKWILGDYFKFEDFFNSVLQELNKTPITKETSLISLLVHHKAQNAMDFIKKSLSAEKQKEWTSAIKMTVEGYQNTWPVFSEEDLQHYLSKSTPNMKDWNDKQINKILKMAEMTTMITALEQTKKNLAQAKQNPGKTRSIQAQIDQVSDQIEEIQDQIHKTLDQIIEGKEDTGLFSTAKKTRFKSMTFLQLIIYLGNETLILAYLKRIQKTEIINKVLEKNNESQTVLHFLALKGFYKVTKTLSVMVENSVDLWAEDCHQQTPLDFAVQEDQKMFVEEMLKKIKWSDPKQKDLQITRWVHQSVSQNAKQVLLYLIELKKDSVFSYNPSGETPLMKAAKHNNISLLKILISNSFIDQYSSYGCTALHIAIKAGAIESAMMLINKGANPQLTDLYARTAFHMAAFKGSLLLMIKIMENKRECMGQCDVFNNTALHYAAYANQDKTVAWLVQNGLDSQKRNIQQEFNQDLIKAIEKKYRGLFDIESPIPKYQQSPADMALIHSSGLAYLACFDPYNFCLNETTLNQNLIFESFLLEDVLDEDIREKMGDHGFQFLLKEKNSQSREQGLKNLLLLLGEYLFLTACNRILSLADCHTLFMEESILKQGVFLKVLNQKIGSDKDYFETLKMIIKKGSVLNLRYFLKDPSFLGNNPNHWEALINMAIQFSKEEMAIYLALDPRSKESSFKALGTLALRNQQYHAFVLFLLMDADVSGKDYLIDFWPDQIQLNHPRLFSMMTCQLALREKKDPRADVLMRMIKFIFQSEKKFFSKDILSLYFFQDEEGNTVFHYFAKQGANGAKFMGLLLDGEVADYFIFLENEKKESAFTLLLQNHALNELWDILKKIFKLTTEDINQMRKNQHTKSIKAALLSKKTDLLVGYQQRIKQVFDELDEDNHETKLRDLLKEINPHEILKYIDAYHQRERPLNDVFFKKAKIALNCLYQEIPEVFQNSAKRYPSIPLQHIFEDMVYSYRAEIEMPFFDYLTDLYLFSDSIKSRLHQKPILCLLSKVDDTKKDRLIGKLLHAFFSQSYQVEKEFSGILDVMHQLKDIVILRLILEKLEKLLAKEEVKPDRLDEKVFLILNVTFAFMPTESAHFLLKHQHKLKQNSFKDFLLTQKTNIVEHIKAIRCPNHTLTKRVTHEEGTSFSHKNSVHEFLALLEESKLSENLKHQIGIYVLDDYYENKSQSKKRKKQEFNLNKAIIKLFNQSEKGCFNKKSPSVEFMNAFKSATRFFLGSATERMKQS